MTSGPRRASWGGKQVGDGVSRNTLEGRGQRPDSRRGPRGASPAGWGLWGWGSDWGVSLMLRTPRDGVDVRCVCPACAVPSLAGGWPGSGPRHGGGCLGMSVHSVAGAAWNRPGEAWGVGVWAGRPRELGRAPLASHCLAYVSLGTSGVRGAGLVPLTVCSSPKGVPLANLAVQLLRTELGLG